MGHWPPVGTQHLFRRHQAALAYGDLDQTRRARKKCCCCCCSCTFFVLFILFITSFQQGTALFVPE